MPRNPLARAAFDYLCDQSGFSINNATADYPDKKDCGWWYVHTPSHGLDAPFVIPKSFTPTMS